MKLSPIARVIVFVLFFLSNIPIVQSQHLNFRNYQSEDGLASSLVWDILQDRKGYIWIATEKGVSRFDGSTFKNFTTIDGLEDNAIISLYEDKKGRIWFTPLTTGTPLSYYYEGGIYNSKNTPILSSFASASLITSVIEDKEGALWVATIKDGLFRLHEDQLAIYNTEKGLPINSVFYLWLDSESSVNALLGTNQVAKFNGDEFEYREIEQDFITGYTRSAKGGIIYPSYNHLIWLNDTSEVVLKEDSYDDLLKKGILWLKEDKEGNLWFRTISQGVFRVKDTKDGPIQDQFLSGKKVTSVLIDHESNIWFTTVGEGVFLLPMGAEEIVSYDGTEQLKDKRITALAAGEDESIWFGTVSGSLHYIKKDGKLRSYTNKGTSVPGGKIRAILPLDNNEVLAGTDINWAWMKDGRVKKSLGVGMVMSLAADEENIYLGSSQGLYKIGREELQTINLERFKQYEPLVKGKINALEFQAGNLLIGSDSGFLILHKDQSVEHILKKRRVVGIAMKDGITWIATEDSGLIRYDGSKLFRHQMDGSSLSSLSTGIGLNDRGIWVSTNRGLNHIYFDDQDSAIIKLYTSSEGMASDEVNTLLVNSNAIWTGTNQGLTKFGLNQEGKNSNPPFIYITSNRLGGESMTLMQEINLEYGHPLLEIGFEGIAFRNSRNLMYRYRMKGYEDAWNYSTFNNAIYRELPSGDFVFEVSAVNEDGVWNENAATVKITVSKPYWETTWFFMLLVVSSILLLFGIYRYITSRIRARERTRSKINQQIAESEMKALRAQMNPHFIFNALNSIQKFLITNDKMMATAYLAKFASLIRKVLDNSRESEVTLMDEIKALELYLELEEMRFADKLSSEVDIDEDVDMNETLIPSMLIQPFVENAIKHGIMHRLEGGVVKIKVLKENDQLMCYIEDNGIGRDASAAMQERNKEHQSLGMQVSEERLNILNAKRSIKLGLVIEDLFHPDGTAAGTKVTISIPLHRKS